jgi:hypothetical protein
VFKQRKKHDGSRPPDRIGDPARANSSARFAVPRQKTPARRIGARNWFSRAETVGSGLENGKGFRKSTKRRLKKM